MRFFSWALIMRGLSEGVVVFLFFQIRCEVCAVGVPSL